MHIDIVFDGPPSNITGRFVEVEDAHGRSIRLGAWIQRSDGYWALRLTPKDVQIAVDRESPDGPGWEGGFARNH